MIDPRKTYTHMLLWCYEGCDWNTSLFESLEESTSLRYSIMKEGEEKKQNTYFEEYDLMWMGSRFHNGER